MSAENDQSDHAALLAAQFGGTWTQWTGGAAGIPGATLWTQHQPDEHGRPIITGMLLFTDRVTTDALRKIPASVLESALAGTDERRRVEDLAALPPLERGSLAKPDFLRLVADHFKTWSRYSAKPSRDMARASGHPENTIYSWIREARQAGLLPPGRTHQARVSFEGTATMRASAVPKSAEKPAKRDPAAPAKMPAVTRKRPIRGS